MRIFNKYLKFLNFQNWNFIGTWNLVIGNSWRSQAGQLFILSLLTLTVVTVGTLAILTGSFTFKQNSRYNLDTLEATNLAEAGIDQAVAVLNKTGGSYTGTGGNEVFLDPGSYQISITPEGINTKLIESTGYVPNKTSPKSKRTVKVKIASGIGTSFVYGIQVGEGGLELGTNNQVTGSIYSNGNISLGNNNIITGDAWVAGGAQTSPNQEFADCDLPNCSDFVFGTSVSGKDQFDVAQSFRPSETNVLTKVSLKLKRTPSFPPDAIVRIMEDNNGKPDKNKVLTSGTLYASLVTESYGWTDVTFISLPTLTAETPYWIMVDTSSNSTNYWYWHTNFVPGYSRGSAKWSSNWQAGNPTWDIINTGDLSFKAYLGGVVTQISGGSGNTVSGNVNARTIESLTIGGDAYYQSINNSTVSGSSCTNNTHCHPGQPDPAPKVFPISQANISQWKLETGQVTLSNPPCGSQTPWGPGKFTDDLTIGNNCTIIVKSPIWITGNITLGNTNILRLDSSYGATSGVILSDGKIAFGNTNKLEGTGTGSSLLMALSTYDSNINNGQAAITIGNNGNTGVFYANLGIIEPGNNNQFKELTAWGIRLTNNSTINYDTGLSSILFSSGPSGSYSVIKGTYQVK